MTEGERADVLRAEFEAFKVLMNERDLRYAERFKATDERTNTALASSEKAVAKAEQATEKRFDSVNEFRGQLKDQASTLISRAESDAKFNSIEEKLETIKASGVATSRWTLDKALMLVVAAVGWLLYLWRSKP